MGKRLRRERSVCARISPRSCYLAPHSTFYCYEEDVWTAIARFLSGRSLVMLALTSKWFYHLMMDESIWKFACLRDLQVPEPKQVTFKWISLYASAFGRKQNFFFPSGLYYRMQLMRPGEKRITALEVVTPFRLRNSGILTALVTESLSPVEIPEAENMDKILESGTYCVLKNIRTGIWIADLQLVRCPICDLSNCEGTMQTLDARHIELFLSKGYQDGKWVYQVVGAHDIKENTEAASGAIFDVKHLKDSSTSAIFDVKSWVGKPADWQPKAMVTGHAVAVNTNLQKNEGLHLKYHVMRAGDDGEVVSIRISQQLL